MPLDTAAALEALKKVKDPELHRDLVSLGMIKDLTVDGDLVRLKVELTTPACPLKDTIGRDVTAALQGIGARRVEIAWGAQVRSAPGVAQSQLTPGVKNPLPWLAEMMDIKKEQNFFEGRVTEYQKASSLNVVADDEL